MITDAILTLLFTPIRWMLDLIPSVSWPSWLASMPSYAGTFGDALASVNNWFPVSELLTAVGFVLVLTGVHYTSRLVRMLISVFTGGGGAV